MEKEIVLATKNKGKVRECQEILGPLGYKVYSIDELVEVEEPEETGTTFEENALLKARYYMKYCGKPCLADDSGLEVDVLHKEPGIYSARYAGVHGDDEKNNEKLIQAVRPFPVEKRTARYVCALALVFPDKTEHLVRETCEGLIQDEYAGTGGFGYDPLFYIPKYKKTMAELTLDQKNAISHRGKALRALVELLG